jgi:hypothetical protein
MVSILAIWVHLIEAGLWAAGLWIPGTGAPAKDRREAVPEEFHDNRDARYTTKEDLQ